MSSDIPLQVDLDTEEQKEISPNKSKASSKSTSIHRQYKECINSMKLLTKYLLLEKEKSRLENEKMRATFILLYSQHITSITSKRDCVNTIAKQNEEQYNMTPTSFTLHDPNIVHNASVVETPTAISQPANTSGKSISIPIKLIISIPSNEEQSSMPEIPQIVIDTPVADIATIIDANDVSQAPREPDAVNNHQLVLLHSARSSITLYDISMVKATDRTLATRPQSPLLVHLVMTAHRLLHHPAYAQLVNLVPFDPGGK